MGLFGISNSWRKANKLGYVPDFLTETTQGYPQFTTQIRGMSKSTLLQEGPQISDAFAISMDLMEALPYFPYRDLGAVSGKSV
jgi:hypothetical protein